MSWILQTNDFKKIQLPDSIEQPSGKDIMILSLKKLGFFWAISLFCIFIPVLHFFLTPIFFLVGILAFLTQYRNTHFIKELHVACPSCQQNLILKKFYFSEDKKITCDHCATQLFFKTTPNL